MEMDLSQCVAREFVRQYYTQLNKNPSHLHRYYGDDSSFVRDGLKKACGQREIHETIMHMGFQDCKVKIFLIEGRRTLENGLLVEVFGALSNNGQPMRPFVQLFVLALFSPKKYYVRNDIFHYQDDIDMLFDNEDSSVVASLVPKDSIPVPAVIPGCGGTTSNVNGADQAEEQRIKTTTSTLAGPVPAKVLDETDPGTVLAPPVSVQVGPKGKSVSSKIPFKSTTNFASASSNAPSKPETYANRLKSTPSPFGRPTSDLTTTSPPISVARSTERSRFDVLMNNKPNQVPVTVNTATPASGAYPAVYQNQQKQHALSNTQSECSVVARESNMGNRRLVRKDQGPAPLNWPVSCPLTATATDGRMHRNTSSIHPSSMGVGPTGFGSANSKNLEVFVGNVPHYATDSILKEFFQQKFGHVVRVIVSGDEKRPELPHFAFVHFDCPEAAENAVTTKPLLLNNQHRLNVERKKHCDGQYREETTGRIYDRYNGSGMSSSSYRGRFVSPTKLPYQPKCPRADPGPSYGPFYNLGKNNQFHGGDFGGKIG